MILIDNYDSFTYNIFQAFQTLGKKIEVIRNDHLTVDEILAKRPSCLVIGPGPGTPSKAGVTKELIAKASVPLLGICLGHQAIGEVFGARLERAPKAMHGKTSSIYHYKEELFKRLSTPFQATRYHSLILQDLPPVLEKIAWTDQDEIMGVRHVQKPIWGIQFHPESISTPEGIDLLQNFLCHSLKSVPR